MAAFQSKISIGEVSNLPSPSPRLHGFDLEHIGRVIYDGIWVRKGSRYSKQPGVRTELVDWLKHVRPGTVRWPGGGYANTYRWEDGIGPRDARPPRIHGSWNDVESNHFGTDEFIHFCGKIGAEPLLVLNPATGSVREALNWLSYCNMETQNDFGLVRSQQGNPDPYRVSQWQIGHEPWGSGGHLTPRQYADDIRRFATFFKQVDPTVRMIVCGLLDDPWNGRLLEELQDSRHLVDGLSFSCRLFSGEIGGGSKPTDDEDYYALFGALPVLENAIRQTAQSLDRISSNRKTIGLNVSDWGIQHPEATRENGMTQPCTLRDALLAACMLHLFYRFSDCLASAHLSHPVNALQALLLTRDEDIVPTPFFHAMTMCESHIGQQPLRVKVSAPKVRLQNVKGSPVIPLVDAFASMKPSGNGLHLTVVNLHLNAETEVRIRIPGKTSWNRVEGWTMTAVAPEETNDFNVPRRVEPKPLEIQEVRNPLVSVLPPMSVSRFNLTSG